jgi:hypothetical protein
MITPMSGEPSYPNFAGKHAEVRGLNVASAVVISDSLADLPGIRSSTGLRSRPG